jgi:hypothetical protein
MKTVSISEVVKVAALAEATVCQRLYVKAGRQATPKGEAFTWRRRTVTIWGHSHAQTERVLRRLFEQRI